MAKSCQIAREKKRTRLNASSQAKRVSLKKMIIDESLPDDERRAAMFKLNTLSANSSRVRMHRRCVATGRTRGVYRKFQLNRIVFREMALEGLLPGVTKASW